LQVVNVGAHGLHQPLDAIQPPSLSLLLPLDAIKALIHLCKLRLNLHKARLNLRELRAKLLYLAAQFAHVAADGCEVVEYFRRAIRAHVSDPFYPLPIRLW
jgi:hypothetical protein